MNALTPDQAKALDVARGLAAAGVPLFVAPPCPGQTCPIPGHANGRVEFHLPARWQTSRPLADVVDRWRPGWALCAVMGHRVDLVDVDPRNGGDATRAGMMAAGTWPRSYGQAATPSGGTHDFIAPLGVGSHDAVAPGLDVKGGAADGTSRGCAFIAPTVRVSKTTGQPAAYRWIVPPDLSDMEGDDTGRELAAMVEAARHRSTPSGGTFDLPNKPSPWADIRGALSPEQGGRRRGVLRLACALRGRGGWRPDDAEAFMRATVWPLIDQQQSGHPFTPDEFTATIRDAFNRYDDGSGDRADQPTTAGHSTGETATPGDPGGRYFAKREGLKVATLAGDIIAAGPLAEGADDIVWSYHDGVWRPDRHVVRARAAALMGELYRRSHGTNAEDVVRARVPRINADPVPQYINFTNGLLDWRTGQLRDHTPEVLSTVQLGVPWQPGAQCPQFDRFLACVVPADMVETVWELIGYLMYSGNPLHKAVMLMGTGRNGKGTFLRVVTAVLGEANVTAVSLHDLVGTRFATVSLFGKLANIAGDIDGTYLESTATFKAVTGQDQISAEHKGRDRFDFTPWAVPVFSANAVPASADATTGYLSRWLVIPFPHDFTGREDRHLLSRLTDPGELAGIAARAVPALRRLLERGDFELSESARAAREEFIRRVDQVRTWLAECCHLAGDDFVNRSDLYTAFKQWAARDGHKPVKAGTFYDRLNGTGCVPVKLHGVNGYRGVRVVDWAGPAVVAKPSPTLTSENTPGGEEGEDAPYPTRTRARAHMGGLANPSPPSPPSPPGSPGQCIAPGCDRPPRAACRTCWDHRDHEPPR